MAPRLWVPFTTAGGQEQDGADAMRKQRLNEWIALAATEQDKDLLLRIAELDGSPGASATVRRLIRDEARRRGLLPAPEVVATTLEPVVTP